ncbi:MAG: hypothetical protein FJ403_12305 [Verrucomicrobia bacterium]|nr:hypothetical protein [Verrucomicrobiota bacterium]
MSESLPDANLPLTPNELDDALRHLQQAERLLAEGRSFEALRLAESAAAHLPGIPGMHYLRAVCLKGVDRPRDALEAAQAELRLSPDHKEAQMLAAELAPCVGRLANKSRTTLPTEQRPWNTGLARDSLLKIQNAIGGYSYRGIPMVKNPFDVALYPLLLWNLKPRSIIEIGSNAGGSAVWLADLLNNFGIDGRVYSLDIIKVTSVGHTRVTFLEGDGRALASVFSKEFLAELARPCLVIDDADHAYETSFHILEFFHPFMEVGEYMVIEDGIISDTSQNMASSSGPHLALKEFLGRHRGAYEIDSDYCDYFGYNFTWCTNGFLKRVA